MTTSDIVQELVFFIEQPQKASSKENPLLQQPACATILDDTPADTCTGLESPKSPFVEAT